MIKSIVCDWDVDIFENYINNFFNINIMHLSGNRLWAIINLVSTVIAYENNLKRTVEGIRFVKFDMAFQSIRV